MKKKEIGEILKQALRHGADFAELFWEHKETSSIGCEDNHIERINSGIDEGVGIRVLSGKSTSYAYTNELNLEKLLEVADQAGKAAKSTEMKKKTLDFYTPKANAQFEVVIPPDTVEIADKVQKVLAVNNAARKVDPRIRQVSVGYGDVRHKVTIANTEGVFVEDERTRTRLSVNAIAAENDKIQTGFYSVGGNKGFELLEENDPIEIGEKAAERAKLMLTAKPAPTGKMPVIMAGDRKSVV